MSVACRAEQDILYSTITALEQQLQGKAEAWSQARLLHYCLRLHKAVTHTQTQKAIAVTHTQTQKATAEARSTTAAAAATGASPVPGLSRSAVRVCCEADAVAADMQTVTADTTASTAGAVIIASQYNSEAPYRVTDCGSKGASDVPLVAAELLVSDHLPARSVQLRLTVNSQHSYRTAQAPRSMPDVCCYVQQTCQCGTPQLAKPMMHVHTGTRLPNLVPEPAQAAAVASEPGVVMSAPQDASSQSSGKMLESPAAVVPAEELHTDVQPSHTGKAGTAGTAGTAGIASTAGKAGAAGTAGTASHASCGPTSTVTAAAECSLQELEAGLMQAPQLLSTGRQAHTPVSKQLCDVSIPHAEQLTRGTENNRLQTLRPADTPPPEGEETSLLHTQSCHTAQSLCTSPSPVSKLPDLASTDAASLLVQAAAAAAAASAGERAHAGPFPWPYYFIGTRDSFKYELVQRTEQVSMLSNGNQFGT